MRFGFSDGSCGSVRGSWRFQSPSPKSVENSPFWSLGEMAADPRGGVHNSGAWGLKLAKRVLPCLLGDAEEHTKGCSPHACCWGGPPLGGVHNSGSLGPGACEKGTPARAAGKYTIREFALPASGIIFNFCSGLGFGYFIKYLKCNILIAACRSKSQDRSREGVFSDLQVRCQLFCRPLPS